MRQLSALLAISLAVSCLPACAGAPDSGDDEFADIEIASVDQADTVAAPTNLGTLLVNQPAIHNLVAVTSGYHLYGFDGAAGERLHLTLDSAAFRTYLRVTAPSGARINVAGVARAGGWRSAVDPWVLPATGHYQILATAYQNMQSFPSAKAHGSYTLLAAADPLPLTVTVAGAGTVTSTPAGISCGAACTASYPLGTVVTLTASPGVGNHLAGWSGACTGAAATCTVSMSSAQSVSAMFASDGYVLNATASGGGALAVSPPGTSCGAGCSIYNYGTVVTVTATPAVNNHFAGWAGACSGTGATCTLTMTSAQTVTAAFALDSHNLVVTSVGSGTVTASPAGASCGAGCYSYPAGSAVTLTATPAVGNQLAAWSGACSGSGATCLLTVTGDLTVSASFVISQYVVTVNKPTGYGVVGGSLSCPNGSTVCSATFPYGTNVTLVASDVQAGLNVYRFYDWSGGPCNLSTGPTCSFAVTSNVGITANFQFVVGLLERVAHVLAA